MNIKEQTIEQLKSLAYDLLVSLEQTQNNLRILNAEIASRQSEVKPEVKEEPLPIE